MHSVMLMGEEEAKDQAWCGPQGAYNPAKKIILRTEQLDQNSVKLPFIEREINSTA